MVSTPLFAIIVALTSIFSTSYAEKPVGSSLFCSFKYASSFNVIPLKISFTIKYCPNNGINLANKISCTDAGYRVVPVPDLAHLCPNAKPYGLAFTQCNLIGERLAQGIDLDISAVSSKLTFIKQRWLFCVNDDQQQVTFHSTQMFITGKENSLQDKESKSTGAEVLVPIEHLKHSCVGTQDIANADLKSKEMSNLICKRC